MEIVRRLLLLEISSEFIDVKIISVSSCMNVILFLEIHGIDTFSKMPILKNEYGSIWRKIVCQLIFYYLMMFFLLQSVKKKISGTIAGCYLSLPEQDHLVSVLKGAQNCSSASGSP